MYAPHLLTRCLRERRARGSRKREGRRGAGGWERSARGRKRPYPRRLRHHDNDTACLTPRHPTLDSLYHRLRTAIYHHRDSPLTSPLHIHLRMPAATTFVRRNVNKLMAAGPTHVMTASTLKARRKSAQLPTVPGSDALDADVAVLQALHGFANDRQRTQKAAHRKERKRHTASQAAHAGFARKVSSLGMEEAEGCEDEGELGASHAEIDVDAIEDVDAGALRPITLQVLIKPAKVSKRKGQISLPARPPSPLTLTGVAAEDFEVIPKVRAVIALDDPAPVLPEVDEPWEHIDFEEDEHDHQPSYAQVLAAATSAD